MSNSVGYTCPTTPTTDFTITSILSATQSMDSNDAAVSASLSFCGNKRSRRDHDKITDSDVMTVINDVCHDDGGLEHKENELLSPRIRASEGGEEVFLPSTLAVASFGGRNKSDFCNDDDDNDVANNSKLHKALDQKPVVEDNEEAEEPCCKKVALDSFGLSTSLGDKDIVKFHPILNSRKKCLATIIENRTLGFAHSATTKVYATSLNEFLRPGGTVRFHPRPEWFLNTERKHQQQQQQFVQLNTSCRVDYQEPPEEDSAVEQEQHPSIHFSQLSAMQHHQNHTNDDEERDHSNPNSTSSVNNPEVDIWSRPPHNGLLDENSFEDFTVRRQEQQTQQQQQKRPQSPLQVQQNESSTIINCNDGNKMIDEASKQQHRGCDDQETVHPPRPYVFGRDWDPALHVAIRGNATEAALCLLEIGGDNMINLLNVKGVTPLILAAQKGNITLVKELLRRGADPSVASFNGTTPLLQASHFGHTTVVESLLLSSFRTGSTTSLLDQANRNQTTSLMRASQEGHVDTVQMLLELYLSKSNTEAVAAYTNRRNREQMTALMLAAQRGHASVCKVLIQYGGDEVINATTSQDASALSLACKRGHAHVVRVLVTAGCELFVKDSRGRTCREVVGALLLSRPGGRRNVDNHHQYKEIVELLDPGIQLEVMKQEASRERNFEIIRMWNLLQRERAIVPIDDEYSASIHNIEDVLKGQHPSVKMYGLPYLLQSQSKQALLRTMKLPAPLVATIAQYLPIPLIWSKRLKMLTTRCVINPDAAIMCALDLIDEVLEEGGLLEACDFSNVTPPTHFSSWNDWKTWCQDQHRRYHLEQRSRRCSTGGSNGTVSNHMNGLRMNGERANVTIAKLPVIRDREQSYALVELRRIAGYLQLLAHRSTLLVRVLSAPPYNMPSGIIQHLITINDVASLIRRMGTNSGVHFEATVAMDVVMLVSRLCSWFWRERESTGVTSRGSNSLAISMVANSFINSL